MGPTQNAAPAPTPAPAPEPKPTPAPTPTPDSNMMAAGNPKKSGKGMVYGMIFLAILAIAGIGFGVWTMLDSNTQKEQLNSQITTLKAQNNELLEKLAETESEDAEDEGEVTEEQEAVSLWPAKAGVVYSNFYVLNDSDEVIAKDESISIENLLVCDQPVGPQVIKEITCGVTYDGGKEGEYFYNGETGALKFYTADEWKAYLDSQK